MFTLSLITTIFTGILVISVPFAVLELLNQRRAEREFHKLEEVRENEKNLAIRDDNLRRWAKDVIDHRQSEYVKKDHLIATGGIMVLGGLFVWSQIREKLNI